MADLPTYVADLSTRVFTFGPWQFDMSTLQLDINTISQQLLSIIQPLLGRTGTLVGTIASGSASIFGWTFFVLIVSYFVMIESSGLQKDLFKVEIPGYEEDLRKLGSELSRIWNAFLRGQIIIFALFGPTTAVGAGRCYVAWSDDRSGDADIRFASRLF